MLVVTVQVNVPVLASSGSCVLTDSYSTPAFNDIMPASTAVPVSTYWRAEQSSVGSVIECDHAGIVVSSGVSGNTIV